jgi:hypothetical protein
MGGLLELTTDLLTEFLLKEYLLPYLDDLALVNPFCALPDPLTIRDLFTVN